MKRKFRIITNEEKMITFTEIVKKEEKFTI